MKNLTLGMTIKSGIVLMLVWSMFFTPACNTSRTVQGGAIGTAGGAAVGAGIGKLAGNTAMGAIIGAAVGGTAGALIGRSMDKQAEEIQQDMEGVEVERVGEGILLTFDSGLLFDYNSADLKSVTRDNLAKLSEILQKYDDTDVLIEGHTDSKGSDEYNQELSEGRANSVASYLAANGISTSRLIVKGYGESQPVADNETDTGRAQNRRVNLAIFANEELKKAAEKGQIGDQ